MLTGPGPSLASWAGRQKSTPWAIMLFVGYWLMLATEFSMIRFHPGEDGKWIASTADQPEAWVGVLVLGLSVLSLIAAAGFIYGLARESRQTLWLWGNHELTGNDVVHIVAWMHVFQTAVLFLYGFVLEEPLFAVGTVAGFLESASFQLFLLILIPLWFRRRLGEIGVCRPVRIKQMLVLLLVLFLLILYLLDVLVTNPLSDWLGLSLSSEREQLIEREIVSAKETDLLAAVASLAIIGIMVPIAEEILFRGVIQTYLVRRVGAVAGIVLSSFWFALLHIDVALFAPLFVIGLLLGFVRHRYQSIWGAVLLHAVNNMTGVLYYFN